MNSDQLGCLLMLTGDKGRISMCPDAIDDASQGNDSLNLIFPLSTIWLQRKGPSFPLYLQSTISNY